MSQKTDCKKTEFQKEVERTERKAVTFMICSGGHGHIIPKNDVRDDTECLIPGCHKPLASMKGLGHGFCGGCGSPVFMGSPWWSENHLIYVRTPFAQTIDFLMLKCGSCLSAESNKNPVHNEHCSLCGRRVEQVDHDQRISCDVCEAIID